MKRKTRRIFHMAIIIALCSSCDYFDGEQEAFATALVNGSGWTSHSSAVQSPYSDENIDVSLVVLNAPAGIRETLRLFDIVPIVDSEFVFREYPVSIPDQEDPFVYYLSEAVGSGSQDHQYVLNIFENNFYKITRNDSESFEGEFQISLVSSNPEITEIDTLRFTDGFFSMPATSQ